MAAEEQLEQLIELADCLGVQVRYEALGGVGGGLCRLKGQQVLFIDTQADVRTQAATTLQALAGLPELDNCYLRPDLREQIDRLRDCESPP